MATVKAISSLDYYERLSLSDSPESDLTEAPGYFLNTNALRLAELPENAKIAVTLSPSALDRYRYHVMTSAELRGVIFSGSPKLPPNFANIVRHWSPLTPSPHHRGAVYYQNAHYAYCVRLVADEGEDADDPYAEKVPEDELLADGVIFSIKDLSSLIANCASEQFVEIFIPIDPVILGVEQDRFCSDDEYRFDVSGQWEKIYLRVADIMASPDPNHVALSCLRTELEGYGYTY
jgi:hypothetical protein